MIELESESESEGEIDRGAVVIVFDSGRIVVVDKPSGLTSEGAAAQLGRRLVHRIDRMTSGLLVLADDARTVTRMQRRLRDGGVERTYRFVANGAVAPGRRESVLVRDRGDGLRGSAQMMGGPEALRRADGRRGSFGDAASTAGKIARADIFDCEPALDGRATLGRAALVTGRTHQLRIQLAEESHPIVGERVYVRDAHARGLALIAAPRLLLHAERLRFDHPNERGRVVDLTSPFLTW